MIPFMGCHGLLTQKYKPFTLTIGKREYKKFNVVNNCWFADCKGKLPHKGVMGEFSVALLLKSLCTS